MLVCCKATIHAGYPLGPDLVAARHLAFVWFLSDVESVLDQVDVFSRQRFLQSIINSIISATEPCLVCASAV